MLRRQALVAPAVLAPLFLMLAGASCTDGIDTCNTSVDCADGFACETGRCVEAPECPTLFRDGDGDSFGDPGSGERQCTDVSGFVVNDDDCDDTDAAIHPQGVEAAADDVDQDCDGLELCPLDEDDDGVPGALTEAGPLGCAPAPAVIDCDDDDPARTPGANDPPGDDVDGDCDGVVTCFEDADEDGAGGPLTIASDDADCADLGEARDATDCDDADEARFPGAEELVGSGRDEDCDGAEACYVDADDDGFTGAASVERGDADCSDPGESAIVGPDCDDADDTVFPGAIELPIDDVDQDCDGSELCALDGDGDGRGHLTEVVSGPVGCTGPGVANDRSDCDEAGALEGAPCDDRIACTTDDLCSAGVCRGIPDGCVCPTPCDACTTDGCCADTCAGGACEPCVGCACDIACNGSSACDASCTDDAACHVDFSSSAPGSAQCALSRCAFEGGSSTALAVACSASSTCELALDSSGPKDVSCTEQSTCAGTVSSSGAVATQCAAQATCDLSVSTTSQLVASCTTGAQCTIDAQTNGGVDQTCTDATCDTTCSGTGGCALACEGTASCLLRCTNALAPCALSCSTEVIDCPNGELACNTPCPPAE